MYRKYLIIGLLFAGVAHGGNVLPPASESVRKASSLIEDGDQHRNGDPVANYNQAISLLAKQGQMHPNELLLLAKAYVGLGKETQSSDPDTSQENFRRAMVMLDQIPKQAKRDISMGLSQPDAKQYEYALIGTESVLQQAKNGLSLAG
jgi:tetratricopeptide (TPR) repeat protein